MPLEEIKSIILCKTAKRQPNKFIISIMETCGCRFESEYEIQLFTVPMEEASSRWLEWQEYDRGPGIWYFPADLALGIRVQGIHDAEFRKLVSDLTPVENLRYLHLAENRGISNDGMAAVGALRQLRYLNIGACDINNQGLEFLPKLVNLEYLNLSYCNRITEKSAVSVQKLPKLKYLDLQGCIKINTGGLKKFEKKGLTIYKP